MLCHVVMCCACMRACLVARVYEYLTRMPVKYGIAISEYQSLMPAIPVGVPTLAVCSFRHRACTPLSMCLKVHTYNGMLVWHQSASRESGYGAHACMWPQLHAWPHPWIQSSGNLSTGIRYASCVPSNTTSKRPDGKRLRGGTAVIGSTARCYVGPNLDERARASARVKSEYRSSCEII